MNKPKWPAKDLTGQKFNKWTVLERAENSASRNRVMWLCRCDCGVERVVVRHSLTAGISKSCGCHSREVTRALLTTHGMTKTPLFSIWKGMRTRCHNPNSKAWPDYGGRGIGICERWDKFALFYEDMFPSYSEGMTIERINNEIGYQPDNCKWVPKSEQSKNRRSVIYIDTLQGRMSISDAARLAGVSWFCMDNRAKKKWPIEKMLIPSREKNG